MRQICPTFAFTLGRDDLEELRLLNVPGCGDSEAVDFLKLTRSQATFTQAITCIQR